MFTISLKVELFDIWFVFFPFLFMLKLLTSYFLMIILIFLIPTTLVFISLVPLSITEVSKDSLSSIQFPVLFFSIQESLLLFLLIIFVTQFAFSFYLLFHFGFLKIIIFMVGITFSNYHRLIILLLIQLQSVFFILQIISKSILIYFVTINYNSLHFIIWILRILCFIPNSLFCFIIFIVQLFKAIFLNTLHSQVKSWLNILYNQ